MITTSPLCHGIQSLQYFLTCTICVIDHLYVVFALIDSSPMLRLQKIELQDRQR